MSFLKNLMGGVAIMIVALLIGIGQNAVRSNPMTLFPRVSKSPAMTGQKGEAAATPVQRAAADRDRPAGDDTVSPGVAAEITPEELAGGEVSKEKVRAVMGTGFAVIVDARGEHEYDEGHIPSAINIPYEQFVEYYSALAEHVPMDATVICYCRSVTCDLSDNLAQELRLAGYENVVLYRGGWQEWVEAGYPAEGVPNQEEN